MKHVVRWTVYLLGLFLLAFGIALGIKADLGVSAVSSVSYCGSVVMGLNYGLVNFGLYAVFVLAQFILRGRDSRVLDLLQFAVSIVFSWMMDFLVSVIPYAATQHSILENLGLLLVSIVLIGIGASWSVKMKLIPNPSDGFVQAIADRVGWEQGTAKNVVDISCVCITALMGLVLQGELIGIGIGTVISMLGVGRVVALTNRFVTKKLCAAAGVA